MINLIFKWPKILISAIYENISEKAKKANTTVKGYLGDDKNIEHISLVVYDLLPLAVKLGFRHEIFNNHFHKHFKSFRNKIYSYEESIRNTSELMTTEEVVAKVDEIQNQLVKKIVRKRKTTSISDINKSDNSTNDVEPKITTKLRAKRKTTKINNV